ncbi:expressed unknown protein [Seminavis robusta]|uniref:Uncharacterized protein n=1 Tax=Seminavis robusta TaxID=568900 RepID=A0A9N8F0U4_9STRA|nr:expressed unknown protein [Seminavis robusta]|eukprot:Sro2256_g321090.1 n/a (136) ;mRNA; r:15065-15472
MANFLKRRDGRPRWSKRGNRRSKESRLPTRAMIQLLRRRENPASAAADDSDSNSDMSTFDATRDYYHHNNKSAAADDDDDKLYPILHPTADGTGLEVNFTTTPSTTRDYTTRRYCWCQCQWSSHTGATPQCQHCL